MENATNGQLATSTQVASTMRAQFGSAQKSIQYSMVNRRSNPQLIGWLAPTAHPAHGGTDERPAS